MNIMELINLIIATAGAGAVFDRIISTDFEALLRDAIEFMITPGAPYSICFGHQLGTLTTNCDALGNAVQSIGLSIATLLA